MSVALGDAAGAWRLRRRVHFFLFLALLLGGAAARAQVQSVAATFLEPTQGAEFDPSFPIRWTARPGVQAYYLYVGTAPGLKNLIDSRETQSTQWPARDLPAGETVHARIHTKYATGWVSSSVSFTVRAAAVFTNPAADGATLSPGDRLRWTSVEGAEAYYLYVGTAPGRRDLLDSRETPATSWSTTFIPAGSLVYARIHTKVQGRWQYSDIAFRLEPKAVFIDLEEEGQELDPRSSLLWTQVDGAQAYYLYVGTQPGLKDVHDSRETQALSFDLESLPRGRLLHATLHTKWGNTWRQTRRAFRVRPVATLVARTDSPSRIDTRIPLRWIGVEGAEAYYLYVGSTPGAKDLINSRETLALEFPLESLPAGRPVYVRLHTKHGGVWRSVDAHWITKPVAYLNGDVAATGTWAPATPLTWAPVEGATRYFVYVGSSPGTRDLASSGEISGTTFMMPAHNSAAIPADRIVHVRLHTLLDGRWDSIDYTLEFKVASQLAYPMNGASNVDVSAVLMSWNAITGAAGYRLQLGTTTGASDLLDTGTTNSLEWRAGAIPGGRSIHARLWTRVGGEWRYSDSTFSTRIASALIRPRYGELNADLSQPIAWASVAGADRYRVEIGSTPGGRDLFDTGETTSTSASATPQLLAMQGTAFVRVWTRHGGTWRSSDSIFTRSFAPQPASMIWVTDADAFLAAGGFRWTDAGPLADLYRLRLGTAPNQHDLHDSGQVRTERRLVGDLPENVPLHGSLETHFFDGSVSTVQFQFVVADARVSHEDRWTHAMWTTAEVRDMAMSGNVPLPHTLLLETARLQGRESANCTTYARAMIELTRQINLGLDIRYVNTCLNAKSGDCHTLVELFNPVTDNWEILDPTFGFAVRRTADGAWATAMDIFTATRDANFSALEYVTLTGRGATIAEAYYIYYPLLFAQLYSPDSSTFVARTDSILPYYELTGSRQRAGDGFYAIRCLSGTSSVSVKVVGSGNALPIDANGMARVSCANDADSLSRVFRATLIEPVDDAAYEVAIPRRGTFD